MHSAWRTHNDFMEDIWALSEIEGVTNHQVEEPPPASILEYRAQMEANNTSSVYDNPHRDEGVTYIMSGRGRGGISTILRPGVSQLSDSLVAEDVQRKIRQVSGLGYSNAMIEQGVKALTVANSKKRTDPTASQTSPSKTSAAKRTSGLCSPAENESGASSCSSSNRNSPRRTAEAAGHPPPLSVMRRKAEEERAKKRQEVPKEAPGRKNPTARNGSGSPWKSSGSSSDEGSWRSRDGNAANRFFKPATMNFNLDCNEFPALK